MPRKKGQKQTKTLMKEKGNVANPVKKIKSTTGSKERVANILEKERESPSKRKHPYPIKCIPLEYPTFIFVYGNGAGYALCEAKKSSNGKPSYTPLAYTSKLAHMFELVVDYSIKMPLEVKEISEKLDHVYNMIEARIADKSPKEIFKEYENLNEFLEGFVE